MDCVKEIEEMKMTTGYEFQGYLITEYIDVIFDEMLVGLGFGKSILSSIDNVFSAISGGEASTMITKLNDVKQALRTRVVNTAKEKGANALIGIDFESSKLGDLLMVSMTATAVKIEKIVEPLPVTEEMKREKEAKAQEIEIQQKRAKMLKELADNSNFSIAKEEILETLKGLPSEKERYEYMLSINEQQEGFFDDKILEEAQKIVTVSRMYGKGDYGLIRKVTEYLSHF